MTTKRQQAFPLIYIALLILVILRVIAFVFPETRFWGINHINFLSENLLYPFIALALMILILPFFNISGKISIWLVEKFNLYFFNHRRSFLIRLIFIALFGLCFSIFVMPTHFLGDGYLVLNEMAGKAALIFKWSEIGTISIVYFITWLLGGPDIQSALWAFRITSVLAGMISLYFYFPIAARLTDDHVKRFICFAALFLSGSLLLFFGYVENYSLLWPVMAIFLYLGLDYIKNKGQVVFVFLALIVGLFLHLQLIVLIPAAIFILFANDKGYIFFKRYKGLLITIFMIITVILIYLFYMKFTSDLYVQNTFLPLFNGKPVAPDYYIFSLSHLADIFNQMLLVSPIFILIFILSASSLKQAIADKQAVFLLLISIGSIIFVMVIDPQLTFPRDFDLFSLTFVAPTLLLIKLLNDRNLPEITKYSLPLILFMILSISPFLLTNLQAPESIAYVRYIIDLDREKSASTMTTLKTYYEDHGDTTGVKEMYDLFASYHPDLLRLRRAGKAAGDGDVKTARKLLATIKPNIYSYNYHAIMGMLYQWEGKLNRALDEYNAAIQLNRYNSSLYRYRGDVQKKLGQYYEAMKSYRSSFKLDSSYVIVIERLCEMNLITNNIDSVKYYANMLTSEPFLRGSGYYYLTVMSINTGNYRNAAEYYKTYIEKGQDDPQYSSRVEELSNHLKNLKP